MYSLSTTGHDHKASATKLHLNPVAGLSVCSNVKYEYVATIETSTVTITWCNVPRVMLHYSL